MVHDYTVTQSWSNGLTYTKKNGKDYYMKMVQAKKIVGHPKLKLWTFFLGHGERKWPLAELEVNISLGFYIA